MQPSPQTPDRSRCHICRAALLPGSTFCASCGTRVVEMPVEELRSVIYLLSELTRWEAKGIINSEQAATLRRRYEHRRETLRARIESKGKQAETRAPSSSGARAPEPTAPQPAQASSQTQAQGAEAPTAAHAQATEAETPDYAVAAAFSQFISKSPPPPAYVPPAQKPRRTLIETLADPYSLRLLLYTGAAMLVVGIVIWLRDVLYLKLQEPLVQAALLALGTLAITASGWYTVLRTRQRLTGRALTLIGSVLVPINFWFLVRSGLIANNGRAWIVCAFCAMLYAHTAALLRERLYVYLACIASIATSWALVFRSNPDAFGLYALTLMGASLVFLHLSRMFPVDRETERESSDASGKEERADSNDEHARSRFSYELWGTPLVRVALTGATLCALLYMPLRLWPSSLTLYDGIFHLRASTYDPSLAMLLFAAAAYVAWFTGRYIYRNFRSAFYTLSTLALFWTEFLALDGFRLTSSIHFLVLAGSALAIAIVARIVRVDDEVSRAFHTAGVLLSLALAVASVGILLTASAYTIWQSAALACLGLSFALLSTPRFCERLAQAAFAHASAIFASLAFLIALNSASLQSQTLFVAALAAWPFALYTCAILAGRQPGEGQLTAPFVRVADTEFVLLFLWASMLALFLHVELDKMLMPWRPAMFCAVSAAVLYGALRGVRERSAFGAMLASLAALTVVAASLDALRVYGLWPASWPIAAGVICAAFLIGKAAPGLLERKSVQTGTNTLRSLDGVVLFVMDSAVLVCALLWFATSIYYIDEGGFGAPSVLLLALGYWIERAARSRSGSIAHVVAIHTGVFFIALLIALRIDTQWFAAAAVLILFPIFFAISRRARERDAGWVASPASVAAVVTLALAFALALLHAAPHLQPSDPLLLAPLVSLGAIALFSFCASFLTTSQARVRYFRTGVSATVIAFALACLRAGFDPVSDIEIYTSPVAVLLLAVAYLSARRAWDEYGRDTSLLLWMGSLLLCLPLLTHALYFRLLLDVPAPARDIGTLCASLALILFGVLGKLRAPVLVGLFSLMLELATLTLTSVDWLQVPLKFYLITVGALIFFTGLAFEYWREQIMLARKRFNEHREYARERFGEWR